MHSRQPPGWPGSVEYLTTPKYARSLAAASRDGLRQPAASMAASLSRRTLSAARDRVRICKIGDSEHPANGQHGLFATQHLPPDAFIVEYLGFVHGVEETDAASDYDLSLDNELGVAVDASQCGSEARFINDYRGVRSQGPNAEFRDVWVDVGNGLVEKRIGVYVLSAGKAGKRTRGIAKGEEILVSYGKGFWSHRQTIAE